MPKTQTKDEIEAELRNEQAHRVIDALSTAALSAYPDNVAMSVVVLQRALALTIGNVAKIETLDEFLEDIFATTRRQVRLIIANRCHPHDR